MLKPWTTTLCATTKKTVRTYDLINVFFLFDNLQHSKHWEGLKLVLDLCAVILWRQNMFVPASRNYSCVCLRNLVWVRDLVGCGVLELSTSCHWVTVFPQRNQRCFDIWKGSDRTMSDVCFDTNTLDKKVAFLSVFCITILSMSFSGMVGIFTHSGVMSKSSVD